jgi:uncharacterized protein (UPF0179 family)
MKEKGPNSITLVGLKQAQEGYIFIHKGGSSICLNCKYHQVCIENLEVGRVYTIVGLRENVFPCELHESGVRVVEVTESDIWSTLPSKLSIEGATIIFKKQECDIQLCENYELCNPHGLFIGDKCLISKIISKAKCQKGLSLVKVSLRRFPI